MIDDQDRFQWVNVSSGTSSPDGPGKNPESCKMVVVVVVVVVVAVVVAVAVAVIVIQYNTIL